MLALRSASTQYFSGRPVALQGAGGGTGVRGPWDQTGAAGSGPRWGFRDLGARAPHPGSYNPSPRHVPVRAPAPATDPGGPGTGPEPSAAAPPLWGQESPRLPHTLSWGEGGTGRGPPKLLDLLLLEVIDALAPLPGLLLETPALLQGGDAVLHLLLLVLAHLAPELVRVPQAPRGLFLRLQPLLLGLLSLSPGGGTPAAPRPVWAGPARRGTPGTFRKGSSGGPASESAAPHAAALLRGSETRAAPRHAAPSSARPCPAGGLRRAPCALWLSSITVWKFFFSFFNVYLFSRKRETKCEQGRSRERETQNPKQAPGSELSAQSPTRGPNPQTMRPEPKSDA